VDLNSRKAVVSLLVDILRNGRSFQTALLNTQAPADTLPEIQAIAYGVLRHYQTLSHALSLLMKKPMKNKDKDIELLILTALFQLSQSNTPDYAVVNETVKYAKKGKKRWAANLVNGTLRSYCRLMETQEPETKIIELPQWMQTRFKADWADEFEQIAVQSNIHAPMSIRVNRHKISRDEYLQQLKDADIDAVASDVVSSGIVLKTATPVDKLPNFDKGFCSVQDLAAQLAALLLAPQTNDRVLDACSAPGGKTGHILEQQTSITVDACDIDKKRLERVQENLNRLNLKANIQQADMLDKAAFEANMFDRILLDAPCSALGIIRRHPDIKFLRKETDIDNLGDIQQAILDNGWFWLKTGGRLLYATCSILKQENEAEITQFLAKHNDAKLVKIEIGINSHSEIGLQILPGENKMDGFYYAKLEKQ